MKFLNKIKEFFLCFLRGDCVYSIKKLLVYVFTALVLYLAVFTSQVTIEYLVFIGGLLGLREYSKRNYYNQGNNDK